MALCDYKAQMMAAITSTSLDPQIDRPALEGQPIIVPMLGIVELAHNNLVETSKGLGTVEKSIAALTIEIGVLDTLHDRKGRGTYLGAATQTRAKLNTEVRDVLSRITVDGRPLVDDAEVWLRAGDKLGKKFIEREKLSGDDDAVTRGHLYRARLQWFDAVDTFMGMFKHTGFTAEEQRRLLAPIAAAERQVLRRKRVNSGEPSELVDDSGLSEISDTPQEPEQA